MRDMKKFTSVKIRQAIENLESDAILDRLIIEVKDRAFKVWQDRFDDVYLEDKRLLETKLDYIHLNPLQAHWNLAKVPEEYPYSSAVFYETGMQKNITVIDYREHF
jgi:putative transposase